MRFLSRKGKLRGATVVEFALVAPPFFLLLLGGIEFSRANVILNTMENAAYAGARRGIVPGATAADCEDAAQNILNIIRVNTASITIQPSVITDETPVVTATVQVPLDMSNGWITPKFYLGKSLTANVALPREGT